MSHFLQRLMDRHRGDDLGRTVNQQVLPRPKARFENNSESGAIVSTELNRGSFQASYSDSDNEQNPAHMAQNTERVLAAPQTRQVVQAVQDVPTPPKQPLVNDTAIQPTTARAGMESWNERIESLRLLFEQNSTRPEVLPDVNKSRNAIHQRFGSEIQLTNHHEQSDNQDGTLINQHVQAILRRLNDPQQPEIDAEKTMKSQFNPALSSNPEQINQLIVKPEATLDFVPPATRREKQRIESGAEKSELSHVELQREPLLFRTDSTNKEKALKSGAAW